MRPGDLNFRVEGIDEPGASTIIFSGSLGSDLTMWEPQVAGLSGSARIVRYDTRGHGGSPASPGPYSMDDLADDLLRLMDHLDIERAHLVGLSLGGMTTLRLAGRNPERVDRLAVICTSAWLGQPQGWLDRAATVRQEGFGALADVVVPRWFTPGFAELNPAVMQQHREMFRSTSVEGYAGCCEAIAGLDLRADLANITAPTLALAGEQDMAIPPDNLQRIVDGIADAKLEILDPGAHLASAEQPEQVNRLLAEHFRLAGSAAVSLG